MGRFNRHSWVVGAAALVLAAGIGAIAWASPQGVTTGLSATPAVEDGTFDHGDGMMGPRGPGGPGDRGGRMGLRGDVGSDEFQQRMREREAQREKRQEAFLKLVRDKMTPEEQKQLDSLTATAQQQRDAVRKAQDELFKTTQQIRDLVGKYFPLEGGAAPGTTSTTLGGSVQ